MGCLFGKEGGNESGESKAAVLAELGNSEYTGETNRNTSSRIHRFYSKTSPRVCTYEQLWLSCIQFKSIS